VLGILGFISIPVFIISKTKGLLVPKSEFENRWGSILISNSVADKIKLAFSLNINQNTQLFKLSQQGINRTSLSNFYVVIHTAS